MYHYEKKLDATYKHYQHHPYVKENKKKGGTRVQKQRYMVKQKKTNEWNNISDYIFVFTDIQNCDGHCNGDCDGKTDPL